MVAAPAEDWDLVVWNAKYLGKVQLWNEGEGKARSGNSKEAWQSRYRVRGAPRTKEVGSVKLVCGGFRERRVKGGSL